METYEAWYYKLKEIPRRMKRVTRDFIQENDTKTSTFNIFKSTSG